MKASKVLSKCKTNSYQLILHRTLMKFNNTIQTLTRFIKAHILKFLKFESEKNSLEIQFINVTNGISALKEIIEKYKMFKCQTKKYSNQPDSRRSCA